jgi:hypothetical protein
MFAQKKPISDKLFRDARDHYEKLTGDMFKHLGVSTFTNLIGHIKEQKIHGLIQELDNARAEGLADMDNALRDFKAYRQAYLDKIKAEIVALVKKHGLSETDQFKLVKLLGEYTGKLALILKAYEDDWDQVKAEREREKAQTAQHPAAPEAKKMAVKGPSAKGISQELAADAKKVAVKVKSAVAEIGAINARFVKAIHAERDKARDLQEAVSKLEAGAGTQDPGKLRGQVQEIRALLAKAKEESTRVFHEYTQWYQQGPARGAEPLLKANGLKEEDIDKSLRGEVLGLLHRLSADEKAVGSIFETEIALALRTLGLRIETIANRLPKTS